MDHSAPPSATRLRRNSISTSVVVPAKLSLYAPSTHRLTSSFTAPTAPPPPPLDLELLSLKSTQAYTSLKDVLPAGAALSSPGGACPPTPTAAYEISIRNRLVKQAAWAYLQPMAASPSYSGTDYFHRLRSQFSGENPLTACIGFITWVFDRVLRAIGISR